MEVEIDDVTGELRPVRGCRFPRPLARCLRGMVVMKRLLCIWLPNWPIQRLVVAQPELSDGALVLHTRVANRGERVVACSPQAAAHGIRIGMPVAEAGALWNAARQRCGLGAARSRKVP